MDKGADFLHLNVTIHIITGNSLIITLCCAAVEVIFSSPLTHNKAVVSTITAVVQAAVGLEQEEATGLVIVIGGDARHPQTLPFS